MLEVKIHNAASRACASRNKVHPPNRLQTRPGTKVKGLLSVDLCWGALVFGTSSLVCSWRPSKIVISVTLYEYSQLYLTKSVQEQSNSGALLGSGTSLLEVFSLQHGHTSAGVALLECSAGSVSGSPIWLN